MSEPVALFGIFETAFAHSGNYENPYTDLTATVELVEPDGKTTRKIPMFWDGGATWKFRFSPDWTGAWAWAVESVDTGLDGQAGRFDVTPSDNRGGMCPMEGCPYHFQRQDGGPVWWMGDTAWALYTDSLEKEHTRTTAEQYIDLRAQQGFNVVHSMLISEAGWGNSGGDAFEDLQAEHINPGYWQEVDERLAYLNGRGVTGGLVLAWSDKGRNPNNWREFASQEARVRYARYVTARYSALNTYFVVAGEWNADLRSNPGLTEAQAREEYKAIGSMILENDPHGRLIAIHPTGTGTVREFAPEPWMGFADYQQMYPNLHAGLLASRVGDKPVVNSEYAYYLRDQDEDGVVDKHNSFDVDSIRHATWDIAMGGGYFVTGFGNTYFGGNRNPGPFDIRAEQDDIWEEQIQFVKRLFEDLEWWLLEPHDDLISAPVDRSEDRRRTFERDGRTRSLWRPPETTFWALAEPGRQYVGYVRGLTGGVSLDLGEGDFLGRQFDPRNGVFTELDLVCVEGKWAYMPPSEQDWVVVARARS